MPGLAIRSVSDVPSSTSQPARLATHERHESLGSSKPIGRVAKRRGPRFGARPADPQVVAGDRREVDDQQGPHACEAERHGLAEERLGQIREHQVVVRSGGDRPFVVPQQIDRLIGRRPAEHGRIFQAGHIGDGRQFEHVLKQPSERRFHIDGKTFSHGNGSLRLAKMGLAANERRFEQERELRTVRPRQAAPFFQPAKEHDFPFIA